MIPTKIKLKMMLLPFTCDTDEEDKGIPVDDKCDEDEADEDPVDNDDDDQVDEDPVNEDDDQVDDDNDKDPNQDADPKQDQDQSIGEVARGLDDIMHPPDE